jgi:hypothetical protein
MIILSRILGVLVTIDGVRIGYRIYWPLVYTTRNYSLQITDTHSLVFFSLLHSPLAVSWQTPLPRGILQLPALRSSNWQLTWLAPRLAAISHQPPRLSSQTDFRLITELCHSPTATSRHFAQLNCWQLYFGTRLTLLVTFRHEPHRKQRFHCYSPTIPRPLHVYPLPRERVYRAVT